MKREMEAYIVLLHLVSQGWATFSDIRDLLGWERYRQGHGQSIIAYINEKLPELSKKWGGEVPHINAFMFITDSGECSSYICENVFGCDEGSSQHRARSRNMRKRLRLTRTGIR